MNIEDLKLLKERILDKKSKLLYYQQKYQEEFGKLKNYGVSNLLDVDLKIKELTKELNELLKVINGWNL